MKKDRMVGDEQHEQVTQELIKTLTDDIYIHINKVKRLNTCSSLSSCFIKMLFAILSHLTDYESYKRLSSEKFYTTSVVKVSRAGSFPSNQPPLNCIKGR